MAIFFFLKRKASYNPDGGRTRPPIPVQKNGNCVCNYFTNDVYNNREDFSIPNNTVRLNRDILPLVPTLFVLGQLLEYNDPAHSPALHNVGIVFAIRAAHHMGQVFILGIHGDLEVELFQNHIGLESILSFCIFDAPDVRQRRREQVLIGLWGGFGIRRLVVVGIDGRCGYCWTGLNLNDSNESR